MIINATGQNLEIEWDDDTVKFFVEQEDGLEQQSPPAADSITFATEKRVINSATLIWDDGEEIRD